MRRKLFGTMLAAFLIMVQTAEIFAAGSRTAEVSLPGENASYYKVQEGTQNTFAYLEEEHSKAQEIILKINRGESGLESIVQTAPELSGTLENKNFITVFFNLVPVNGGILTENGEYLVTFGVPSLTSSMTDVKILHYSTVRSVWEVLDPINVDYSSKQITAAFQDLSPVAVIAGIDRSADTAVGTSPQTGSSSAWIILFAAAVAFGGLALVLTHKKRHSER